MLNFLIAIVCQSYDETISVATQDLYQTKNKFNLHACVIVDFIESFTLVKHEPYQTVYIASELDENDTDSGYNGFVKSVQIAVSSAKL